MPLQLSIVIVNWNSVAFLSTCIAAVQTQTRGVDYEIVVIDSGSFDGCGEMLRETYPLVRFIQSAVNLGFGRANNLAFDAARGNAVLFLNPDTEVVGNAIGTLHAALMRQPEAGAIGCRLLNSDLTLQTSCVQTFPTLANQVLDAEWLRRRWPGAALWGTAALYAADAGPQPVQALAGACVMLRREVFERIGRFSDDYFMYAEDIDLCYKTHALGLTNYYLPDATVIHHGGGSAQAAPSHFSVVWMRESICRFFSKTHGRAYGLAYRVAMGGSALARLALLALRRQAAPMNRPEAADGSRRKWWAVLRWSVFRRATLRAFQPVA